MVVVILLCTLFSHVAEGEVQQDPPPVDGETEPKLLIIGIDGVRGDVAESVAQRNNSAFGRIKEQGAWSFNTSVGPYAISGPGWASMLTGVWCDRHGVVDNTFKDSRLSSVPDLFEHLESSDSSRRTAAVYWWEPIGEDILSEDSLDVMERFENDELVRDRAVELLNSDSELDVLFVSIDNPDAVGHRHGFSPEEPNYVAAVEEADDMVAEIIYALEERNLSNENWLTIITSDHGGGGKWLHSHHPSDPVDRNTVVLATRRFLVAENHLVTSVVGHCKLAVVHVGQDGLGHGSEAAVGGAPMIDAPHFIPESVSRPEPEHSTPPPCASLLPAACSRDLPRVAGSRSTCR